MNDALLNNIKECMIYFRNNTDADDLDKVIFYIKDAMYYHENLSQMLKKNTPQIVMKLALSEEMNSSEIEYPVIEQFLFDCFEYLLEAIARKEMALVYDLSDMMQGIPDLEYWSVSKDMRSYWKVYVVPVKKKWKLVRLTAF